MLISIECLRFARPPQEVADALEVIRIDGLEKCIEQFDQEICQKAIDHKKYVKKMLAWWNKFILNRKFT
jgi:hypothetical protein